MKQTKKLKIGLSALHYPVTMARMFWDALEHRDDCEVYSVGPYFDNWIPWANGITLPRKYVKSLYLPLPREAAQCHMPYEMVANEMPDDLDAFICVDAGWHFSTRPHAKVVALIKTDPHAISENDYAVPANYSDYVFTMQTPYQKPGEFYLPYAVDNHWFYPEEQEMKYDACLIGLHYEHRTKLVNALRAKGLNVYYDIGVVYDEYRRVYNSSRVALSWSSLQDLPVRVFEALGMERLLVTNRVPDLKNFFSENDHYLGFDAIDEAVEKVEWALANRVEADTIRQAGYRKVMSGHTFNHRINQLLEQMKLI